MEDIVIENAVPRKKQVIHISKKYPDLRVIVLYYDIALFNMC